MKTIRITTPKVQCLKKNDLLNKDKIFFVVIVTTTKLDQNPKIVFSGISGINKMKRKEEKVLNLGNDWRFQVQDDEVFNISFGLYEMDKGNIYEEYQSKITEIIETDGMNYSDIISTLWEELKDNIENLKIADVLMLLPAVGLKIIQNLRKDDLLGKRSLSYKENSPNIEFVSEFDLTDAGSHYKLQLKLDII